MPQARVAARALGAQPSPSEVRTAAQAPRRRTLLATIPRPRLRAEALLDRFVRGRAWIPVLGVALIGIVAMQVEVLKLGASTGRSMNQVTELSGQLQIERAHVSALESPARITALAASYGLAQPGPTDNHFISAHTSVQRAIDGIHPVDTPSFDANLLREQAVDDTPSTPAASTADATGAGTTPDAADTAATQASASSQADLAGDSSTTDSDPTSAADATSPPAADSPVTAADAPASETTGAAGTDPAAAADPTAADATSTAATGATDSAGSPTTGGSALSGAAAGATASSSGTDN